MLVKVIPPTPLEELDGRHSTAENPLVIPKRRENGMLVNALDWFLAHDGAFREAPVGLYHEAMDNERYARADDWRWKLNVIRAYFYERVRQAQLAFDQVRDELQKRPGADLSKLRQAGE